MALPIETGLAGRYATALFELAVEQKAIDTVKADLERSEALIDESPDLALLVRCPAFNAPVKVDALVVVLDNVGIGGITGKFLKMVASHRRLYFIRNIIKAYRRLVSHHKGQISAEVIVAEPLKDAHRTAIVDTLKSATGGKEVDLTVKIDPAIIGGLVVKVGSRMIDTSLRTKLNGIKTSMKQQS